MATLPTGVSSLSHQVIPLPFFISPCLLLSCSLLVDFASFFFFVLTVGFAILSC